MKEHILKLHGKIQRYAWGGYDFIPRLLGIKKEGHQPYAEYWMGAHASAPSVLDIDDKKESLHELISEDPMHFIGKDVYDKFGELPYLFKVLDVKEMLSIQVHPTKEEAVKGFDAEEKAGVPINAPTRNYKDQNHKPEVMVALSDFWLLHGFKKESLILKTLHEVEEFNFLLPIFEKDGYHGLYKEVMNLPQSAIDKILLPLVKRELSKQHELTKHEPGYWVNKLYAGGQEIEGLDRGNFSIYFFNIVELKPGQAIFQGASVPHAYLEGQNVELMANSDNVLRGGLTNKHIDVIELMKHTRFEAVEPLIMNGELINEYEKNYPCPVPDFAISSIELEPGQEHDANSVSAEIYLVMEGDINIPGSEKEFKKGDSFFVVPGTEFSMIANTATLVYKAFVP